MLKVSAKDFGPIIEGTVDLKPLTIFIGPSNAGKSYLAMLIYSLMEATGAPPFPMDWTSVRPKQAWGPLSRGFGRWIGTDAVDPEIVNSFRQWLEERKSSPHQTWDIPFTDFPSQVQGQVDKIVRESFATLDGRLSRGLQRCCGNLSDLVRRWEGERELQIRLEQDHPAVQRHFRQVNGGVKTVQLSVNLSQTQVNLEGLHWPPMEMFLSRAERYRDLFEPAIHEMMNGIIGSSWLQLFELFPKASYYLPAARSGIAQGHKVIASILVRQSPLAGLQPLEIPTLSGIVTDFIGHILTLEQRGRTRSKSELGEVVAFMEKDVVQGKIDIEERPEFTYPEISYEPFQGQPSMGKFPFHRTSSMVSELAPVILFLKYLVDPGDLIILEEPESHLHPASQRQMARGIARLVNKGVKVLITTHSDYFVGQLNNLMKLSHTNSRKRSAQGYSREDCLKPQDVSAYNFIMDDQKGGSLVKELPITADDGISEEEFVAVSEALYEETVSLQRSKRR